MIKHREGLSTWLGAAAVSLFYPLLALMLSLQGSVGQLPPQGWPGELKTQVKSQAGLQALNAGFLLPCQWIFFFFFKATLCLLQCAPELYPDSVPCRKWRKRTAVRGYHSAFVSVAVFAPVIAFCSYAQQMESWHHIHHTTQISYVFSTCCLFFLSLALTFFQCFLLYWL